MGNNYSACNPCCTPQTKDQIGQALETCGIGTKGSLDPDEIVVGEYEMSDMNILEYERRLKRFAYVENKGFINQYQLMEAFSDTSIFSHLND